MERKLGIVLSHNCHIYGTWRSKEVEGAFKVMIWERRPSKYQVGNFFMGRIDLSRHHVIISVTGIFCYW